MRKPAHLIIIMLLAISCGRLAASSSPARNISIDGIVTTGAFPGNNGTSWETDEVLSTSVAQNNWYLSWDATNLYVGRIGGSNTDNSVIYIHASYSGATFSPTGFSYDQLSPDLSYMGGANFACGFRSGSDDFRTWNGSWSGPDASLAPVFSVQVNGDHAEMIIPWNTITNGNGRPDFFKAVFYQVEFPSAGCGGAENIYSVSPWGTGIGGNGPNVAVNDGSPTSTLQPEGCSTGSDTTTRWWGCYPVVTAIGPNTWLPAPPDAGPDITLCSATSTQMNATAAPGGFSGTWTVVSQPPGSSPVVIVTPNLENTLIQQLDTTGTYVFVWEIDYGGCPQRSDTVVITILMAPDTAIAGPDQEWCEQFSATLGGNAPDSILLNQGGAGTWTLVAGQGTVTSPSDPLSGVTGLAYGPNVFQWTISNPGCGQVADQVTIWIDEQPVADAGPDVQLCEDFSFTLSGNNPVTFGVGATGLWSQLTGVSPIVFGNPAYHFSPISNLWYETVALEWMLENGVCPVSRDTMLLTVYTQTYADAGPDLYYCLGDEMSISANNPLDSAYAPFATGLWTQLGGSGTLQMRDSSKFFTDLLDVQAGFYSMEWATSNGNCPVTRDTLNIFVTELINGGTDTVFAANEGFSDGSITVSQPFNGYSPYLYGLTDSTFQSDVFFGNLSAGIYIVYIQDAKGCMDTINVTVPEIPAIPEVPVDTLFIPTGFSPNADGTNDTWEIRGLDNFPDFSIQVFNVWGNEVFRTSGEFVPWNGQYNGSNLPQGTYYFVIDLKDADHPVYKGSLTLLR